MHALNGYLHSCQRGTATPAQNRHMAENVSKPAQTVPAPALPYFTQGPVMQPWHAPRPSLRGCIPCPPTPVAHQRQVPAAPHTSPDGPGPRPQAPAPHRLRSPLTGLTYTCRLASSSSAFLRAFSASRAFSSSVSSSGRPSLRRRSLRSSSSLARSAALTGDQGDSDRAGGGGVKQEGEARWRCPAYWATSG